MVRGGGRPGFGGRDRGSSLAALVPERGRFRWPRTAGTRTRRRREAAAKPLVCPGLLCVLAFRQGRQDDSVARNEAALGAATAIADRSVEALAYVGLSRVSLRAGDYQRVCSLAERARDLVAGAPGNEQVMPLHLHAAGMRLLGNYDRARSLYLQNLELSLRLDDTFMIAMELHNLGHVEVHRGNVEAARAYFRDCSALREGSAIPYDLAMEHLNRAVIAWCEGERKVALEELTQAEKSLAQAEIVLDPDDRFEVDWLKARLTE